MSLCGCDPLGGRRTRCEGRILHGSEHRVGHIESRHLQLSHEESQLADVVSEGFELRQQASPTAAMPMAIPRLIFTLSVVGLLRRSAFTQANVIEVLHECRNSLGWATGGDRHVQ